jgi:hypothetical protein
MEWIDGYGKARTTVRVVRLILVLCIVGLVSRSCVGVLGYVVKADRSRTRLVCETDYQVLLDACRDLLRQQKEDRVYVLDDPSASAAVQQFPKPLLDLAPRAIVVQPDERVIIQMVGGGLRSSLGIYAYVEGFEKANPHYPFGDRRLIEGLWYFDDQYNDDPSYDKVIDKIIEEGKRRGEVRVDGVGGQTPDNRR